LKNNGFVVHGKLSCLMFVAKDFDDWFLKHGSANTLLNIGLPPIM
jgi:hypothetical protein